MLKYVRLKTLLLGLAVLLITCAIFVSLSSIVPSCDTVNTNLLIQGCKKSDIPPIYYATYIWDEYTPPTFDESDFPQFDESGHLLTDDENLARLSGIKSKISVTPDSENDHRITVSGYLLYFSGGEIISPLTVPFLHWQGGLSNRSVEILIESHINGNIDGNFVRKVTDKNGFFTVTFEFSELPECYWVFVSYPGEEFGTARPSVVYKPSNAVYGTCESRFVPDESRWWIWLIIGLALLASAACLYWYLKHRKVTVKQESRLLPVVEIADIPEVKDQQEIESGGDIKRADISFPDIENTLPSVYGIKELFHVTIFLKDEKERILPSQTCEVDWGDEETLRFISKVKPTEITHVYQEKEKYSITVRYVDKSGKEVSSWRTIRIVDYREEMVRMFGEMLERLNVADTKIGPDMTPREVERLLVGRLEGVSKESIRRVIEGFEEANYSTHPVNRDSYIKMYRAIREILAD